MKLIINGKIYFPTKIEVNVVKPMLCFFNKYTFLDKEIQFSTNVECTRITVYYEDDHDSFIMKGNLKEKVIKLLSENYDSISLSDFTCYVKESNDFRKDYGNKRIWNFDDIKDLYWHTGFSSRFVNKHTPEVLFSILQKNPKYDMYIGNI